MGCEFEMKAAAVSQATALAEQRQHLVLVMFGPHTRRYRVGAPTEPALLAYGAHVCTVYASGLVQYYKAEHEWDVAIGQHCHCTPKVAA